ncbi:hypothetical protein OLEAN_C19640 [Oleispira antarctica RB-8]|uniref:Uncharacterized protein n=1 Tax=Oleispira antarctica RB-8 TaxID=698738 RepID=R4YMY8_OLEAN|nr:hypothetical protein OLEAN_C19640 [Oleispira antarctica RB-8]
MNIHVYLLCYNEESIIKNILDYYSSFCSKIFLMDNISTDRSVEIASEFPKVKIISWASGDAIDESLYVKMKSQTYKDYSREGGRYTEEVADWVISCDMDEVLYHPDIIQVLKSYKKEGVTVPQITGFNMTGENDIDQRLPILDQYMNGVREVVFDKRIVFDADFDMSYSKGCHSYGAGFECMRETYNYKSSNNFPIALLHYKHIGSRLFDVAVKNSERVDADTGASHYKYYKEKGPTHLPLLKKMKPIFDANMHVNFSDFAATTGEKSSRRLSLNGEITQGDVDVFRDSALKLEDFDMLLARELMLIAKRYRPTGAVILQKIKQFNHQLDN